jgi:hypothetical protein
VSRTRLARIGGGLALGLSDERLWLVVAAVLISGTVAISLIGGVGLLFLPSVVLLIIAASRSADMATAPADPGAS